MALKSKSFTLNDPNLVLSNSNCFMEYRYFYQLSVGWNLNNVNTTWKGTNEDGGTNILSDYGIQVDGDLIFSIGWSDGFGIRRLNDDGTLTTLYIDSRPLNNYGYYTSLAVSKTHKKVYVGSYATAGLAEYDYSDLNNIIKTTYTETANGLPCDQFGLYYYNGLYVIGDWLYMAAYDKTYSQVFRWNIVTHEVDNITVSGFRYAGRYGSFRYDPIANRLYLLNRDNGEIWVIVNPENHTTDLNAPAKAYLINIEALSMGNDVRTFCLVPDNLDRDVLWVGGYHGRLQKIRITDIINGTTNVPTVIQRDSNRYNLTNYKGMYRVFTAYARLFSHPVYGSDMILIYADRDCAAGIAWLDQENILPIGIPILYFYGYDNLSSSYFYPVLPESSLSNNIINSYMPQMVKATSAGGNSYWIHEGYGWYYPYIFKTWSVNTFPNGLELSTNGEIVFGQFQLDDLSNISGIKINGLQNRVYQLSGTSLSIHVTNNNGTTWETYDYTSNNIHIFGSTGNSVQVKFVFINPPTKASHITSNKPPSITIFGENVLLENDGGYSKNARINIKGV